LLFVSTTLLFHSQHVYVAVFFPVVFLHTVIFRRDRIKVLSKVAVLVVLVNMPWLIWLSRIKCTSIFQKVALSQVLVIFIGEYVHNLTTYVFPVWLFAVLSVWYVIGRIRKGRFPKPDREVRERLSLPTFFVIFVIIVMVAISPYPFFRYLAPAIPPLILLMAVVINAACVGGASVYRCGDGGFACCYQPDEGLSVRNYS
jgi:4-amino-4-deoxy-L-arabinose transferase-like glycosyltransferase